MIWQAGVQGGRSITSPAAGRRALDVQCTSVRCGRAIAGLPRAAERQSAAHQTIAACRCCRQHSARVGCCPVPRVFAQGAARGDAGFNAHAGRADGTTRGRPPS